MARLFLLVLASILGASTTPLTKSTPRSTPRSGLVTTAAPAAVIHAPSCEEQIDALELAAPTAEMEEWVDGLSEVVVHTRVEPVLYLSWPRNESEARAELEESRRPLRAVRDLVQAHRGDRVFLRSFALSDGYLFATEPGLARALSASLRLEDLFDAETIYRTRAGRTERLDRTGEGYVDASGEPARLRLNDRVLEEDGVAPIHVSLRGVRQQTGALRTLPLALSTRDAALELRFPDGTRRPALVTIEDGRTDVVCVGGDETTLAATLAHADRFAQRQARIAEAAKALVRERPRFDEPVNEPEGVQEDGRLRGAWLAAYQRGARTFTYRDVDYPVFDADGNASPPQVCVDFVFDAWERGGGNWYRSRGEEPGRTAGDVAFRGLPRRSIQGLLAYSADGEGVLQRHDVARRDRVALREGRRFARAMGRVADDIQEGDTLIIHGLREQDMRLHYHAVLVLEVEPISGVPMVVADNQGRPRLRTLTSALRAAPLRSIKYRLRPDFDALRGDALRHSHH